MRWGGLDIVMNLKKYKMIQKVEMFTVICDNCGEDAGTDSDYSCWNDKSAALEDAKESGWIEHKELHYCPKCWSYDDEDNLVLVFNPYSTSAS